MDPCQSFLSPKNRRTSSTKIIIYPVEGVIWQAPDPILSNQFDEHQQIPEVQCIAGAIMTTHILRAAAVPVLLRSSTNWAPAIAYYHLTIRLNGLRIAGYIAASTSMPEEHPLCSADHLDIALMSKQEKQVCQG